MEFTLYEFSKRRNSTKQPTQVPSKTLQGWLKEAQSMYSPTFTLKEFLPTYTYLQWEGRYYFINDFSMLRDGYYAISCELDVLATYKQNILNTSAYVLYSSSDYNLMIRDDRFSMNPIPKYNLATASFLMTTEQAALNVTQYIVSYVTGIPTYGASGVIWLDSSQCSELASMLNSTAFGDWLTSFPKQLTGAYDSVLSCIGIPLPIMAYGERSAKVILGGFDTGINGTRPVNQIEFSGDVPIPWEYSDFRNQPPYTSLLLYLPAYGLIELNPIDYINAETIHVRATLDGITGSLTYNVNNIYRATTSLAVPTNIGTIRTNSNTAILGMGAAATAALAGVFTGGVGMSAAIGITSGIIGATYTGITASQQRHIGSIGSNGGYANIVSGIGLDWHKLTTIVISHNTTQPPDSIKHISGLVCNKVRSLAQLTGYCQTVNASVTAPTSDIASRINNLLNGGIFIE